MKLSPRRAIILAATSILSLSTYLACLTFAFAAPTAAAASCAAIPSSLGTVTLNVSAPASGTYRVWVRMLAPSQSANTFYIQIPDAGVCGVTMGGASMTPNQWTWVDYENGSTSSTVNVNLSTGSHEVQLSGKTAGVEVDTLLLLSDTSCTPTGTGSNCTAAAVATVSPSGSGTASPSPSGTGAMTAMSSSSPSSGSGSMSSMSAAQQASHASFFAKYRTLFIVLALIIIAVPLIWLAVRHFMSNSQSGLAGTVPATAGAGTAGTTIMPDAASSAALASALPQEPTPPVDSPLSQPPLDASSTPQPPAGPPPGNPDQSGTGPTL